MRKTPRNKKAAPPTAKFSRTDKLKIIGFLFVLFGFPILFLHFYSVHRQVASVNNTVEGWKSIYHITDEQAARIKQIELDFHGNGSPFDFKGPPTRDEKHRHHEQISSLMSSEDGARFMQAMEQGAGRH